MRRISLICDTTHSCVTSENNCTLEHDSILSLSSYVSLTHTNALRYVCKHSYMHLNIHTNSPFHELRIEGDAEKLIPQNLQVSCGSMYQKRHGGFGFELFRSDFRFANCAGYVRIFNLCGIGCTYIRASIRTNVRTHINTYRHKCMHTRIHVCIHTFIYSNMPT